MVHIHRTAWNSVRAWSPALALVLIGYIFDWASFYVLWPPLDMPMHALGGGLVAYALHQMLLALPKNVLPKNSVAQGMFVVALTAVVTIAWETYELWQDMLFGTISQLGVVDMLSDMWIGIGGAIMYWLIRKK